MNLTGKIKQQVRYWMIAASILPLTALSGILFLQNVGWTTNLEKLVTIVGTAMFVTAVFWWWWAINKILQFTNMIEKTGKDFDEVKEILNSIKDEL